MKIASHLDIVFRNPDFLIILQHSLVIPLADRFDDDDTLQWW